MQEWVNINDYSIGADYIYDCDGNALFQRPNLTDSQIKDVITIANIAYNAGYENGKLAKMYEIKKALNI